MKIKEEEYVTEIILGSILFSLNNFFDGNKLEKYFVIAGLIIIIIGCVRGALKFKSEDKKGMFGALCLMGMVAFIFLCSLIFNIF